jgi:hypothetical protein
MYRDHYSTRDSTRIRLSAGLTGTPPGLARAIQSTASPDPMARMGHDDMRAALIHQRGHQRVTSET